MQDPNQDFHQGMLIILLKAVGEDNNLRTSSAELNPLKRLQYYR